MQSTQDYSMFKKIPGNRDVIENHVMKLVKIITANNMLAANPIRQVLIQASQALPVILATNPTYMAKLPGQFAVLNMIDRGGTAIDAVKGFGTKLSGLSIEDARALEKAYKESGIQSAVSAHSLIRDDMQLWKNS